MKLEFDPSADAAYFEISFAPVERTEEIEPGINADYDAAGCLLGIEVLSVGKRNLSETFEKGNYSGPFALGHKGEEGLDHLKAQRTRRTPRKWNVPPVDTLFRCKPNLPPVHKLD